ncbi:MAG TPA: bifunctional phosphoribosylaminoimidazolecarboxamide formyltransferase/IMP cyclohydrolase [Geminicoccaceae bacterium]|nr:bifunctional phosphoribosylaminoimidazolecarboxamide formyltransferase/IMP cyclohydrolase [Geminicoccaceae bacterium]
MPDPAATRHRIRRALLSASDKRGLVPFGSFLAGRGVELVSTGGTAAALRGAGLAVTEIGELTGVPEMLGGRVKTLHPKVHGGVLAKPDDPAHAAALAEHGIRPFELVAVNLYPFEATAAAGAGFEDCIEQIDVGGPALIRAAAKNHASVAVATDPDDYAAVMAEMAEHDGATTPALRRRLAAAAFARTAAYDAAIAAWFAEQEGERFPRRLVIGAELRQVARYGENPHQRAAFYATGERRPGVGTARQVQGKELSYNNLNDTDAAFELVAEFERPAVAIVKHANPCGVAVAHDLAAAHAQALASDPVSAFGGIVAVNRPLDGAAARAIAALFTEVVIAPGADGDALAALAERRNLRLLLTDGLPDPAAPGRALRSVAGGLRVQDRDAGRTAASDLKVVTRRAPDERELADLLFAFAVCKHVRSNAIVFAKDGATVGIGAGQMSRVDSVVLAANKAIEAARAAGEREPRTKGSVVASDAFFPFDDGVKAALAAGASAFIQPGGSVRDEEVIGAADEAGAAMVFTGLRHFRH